MPTKQNLILTTYTRTAPTVNALMDMMDCRRIYNDTTQVAAIPEVCLIVNFGSSRLNRALRATRPGWVIMNRPERIPTCASKMNSYQEFRRHAIPTPLLTRDRNEALRWVQQDGIVFVREDGNHQGRGIQIAHDADQLRGLDGDFFSKYLPKTHEYRFHVWGGEVIDVIEKRNPNIRGNDYPPIFNHQSGYLFYRDGIRMPAEDRTAMGQLAIRAVQALQLDFGAVDMLARRENDILVGYAVCEVNSSPALEGEAARRPYVQKILAKWTEVTQANQARVAAPRPARANGNAWG